MVAAGSVKVFQLPWVNALALGTGPSALVVDGAYRLRSTQPVTVYQYNPLNADVTKSGFNGNLNWSNNSVMLYATAKF